MQSNFRFYDTKSGINKCVLDTSLSRLMLSAHFCCYFIINSDVFPVALVLFLHKRCLVTDLSFTLVLSLLRHVEALQSRVSPSLRFYNRPPRPQTVLEMELARRKMTGSADTLQKHQHSSACITAGPVTERHLSESTSASLQLLSVINTCFLHLESSSGFLSDSAGGGDVKSACRER